MLREGVVKHILAASDAFQPRFERVGEVAAVGVADFPSFLVVAVRENLPQGSDERRGRKAVVAEGKDVLDDKGHHRDGRTQDGAPDGDPERAAFEDGLQNIAFLRRVCGCARLLRAGGVSEEDKSGDQ